VRAFSKIQYFSQTAAYKFVVQFPRFWGLKAPWRVYGRSGPGEFLNRDQ
jgi:hypothetical protein